MHHARTAFLAGLISCVLTGLLLSPLAWAGTNSITTVPASGTVTEPSSVAMSFPPTRSSDTSYGAWLNYQTVYGTAKVGMDHATAGGEFEVPAGATSVTLPVSILGSTQDFADKTFSVQLSNAIVTGPTPVFATHQDFATGIGPYSVAVADVNGDGKPDLIVANAGDNTISVLLNTTAPGATTPSFAPQQTFATGWHPDSVAVADLNGDGKPDLIVANGFSNTVSVLLNTTPPGAVKASFAPQKTFATGHDPQSVAVADVNGDGKPDLIVANTNSETVSVLLNTTASGASTPTFSNQQTFATGYSPIFVAAADINGDGKPDLIVANQSYGTISVLLNTTPPDAAKVSFAPQQIFRIGRRPGSLAVADVNGDGKPDLIVVKTGNDTVSVLLNTTPPGAAKASFAPQQSFVTGLQSDSVAVADVTGDGKPDLIVANGFSNTVSVLLNTTPPGASTPCFAPQQTFATGNLPYSVAVADVNGDGKPDLIVANAGSATVSVLLNTTPPLPASRHPVSPPCGSLARAPTPLLRRNAFARVPQSHRLYSGTIHVLSASTPGSISTANQPNAQPNNTCISPCTLAQRTCCRSYSLAMPMASRLPAAPHPLSSEHQAVAAGTSAAADQIDTVIVKNNDIYLSVGSGPILQLTHDGIPKALPLFSKDGSMIAYVSFPKNRFGALGIINVINRQGQELDRVYVCPEQAVGKQQADDVDCGPGQFDSVEQLEWLNNSRIAVRSAINPSTSEGLIYDLPPHGLPEEFNDDGFVSFSPDGMHFVDVWGMPHFTPADEQAPELHMDENPDPFYPAAHSHTQVTFISDPRWSPDSRMFAILARDSDTGALNLVIWHVGGAVTITRLPGTGAALALQPDPETDAYHADVYYANDGWIVSSTNSGGTSSTSPARTNSTSPESAWQLSADGQSFTPFQGAAPPDPQVAARALLQRLQQGPNLQEAYGMDFWCESCGLLTLPRRVGTY